MPGNLPGTEFDSRFAERGEILFGHRAAPPPHGERAMRSDFARAISAAGVGGQHLEQLSVVRRGWCSGERTPESALTCDILSVESSRASLYQSSLHQGRLERSTVRYEVIQSRLERDRVVHA